MSNSSQVTLIIPTVHFRAHLLARALQHIQSQGFNGTIIVSDHSPADFKQVIATTVEPYKKQNIVLLEHSPEIHFLARLVDCAAQAKTDYVHLHADDDFLVMPCLDHLVSEFESEPACVAAMGLNLHVDLELKEYSSLPKTSVDDGDPGRRLSRQLERYSSVLYALRKKEEFIETLSFSCSRCPDVQFWQYLESCVAAIKGRIKVIDELHYVREQHFGKWSTSLKRERSQDHFPHLILSEHFYPRLAAFREAIEDTARNFRITIDPLALSDGLIHLLYRGFGSMGLPPRHASPSDQVYTTALVSQDSLFETRLRNSLDPSRAFLTNIFSLPSNNKVFKTVGD